IKMKRKQILYGVLLLVSTALQAQQKKVVKITDSFSNKSLSLVLLDWEIEKRLKIDYSLKDTKDVKVTASFRKIPLDQALKILLANTNFSFRITGPRQLVIFAKGDDDDLPITKSVDQPTRFDFNISGKILDEKTGESLPYADIIITGTTIGGSTNLDGYFTLFNVPSDTTLLEISYIGYQSQLYRLTPKTNLNNIVITLNETGVYLSGITVTDVKKDQMLKASSGISTVSISPAQLNAIPSLGEKDIFRSLQLLPGISGSNESSSGLFVRGGTPDQNLVLFDGFTVYHVDHLFGFFSAFNSNAVKDVQLYKGGFEAKFGGRISSVVELTGKDGNSKAFNTGFGISLLSMNAFVESPFAKGKGSFIIAGRRSFQSRFYNNLFDSFSGENEANQGPGGGGGLGGRLGNLNTQPNSYFYDLNAKATYRLTDQDEISLSFYNGEDDLDNSRIFDENSLRGLPIEINFKNDILDQTNWGNWGSSLKWSRKWNNKFYSNANLSYSNYFSDRERGNYTEIEQADTTRSFSNNTIEKNDLKDITFKMDSEWKTHANNQVEFGVFSTYNDIEYSYIQNDTISILDRDDSGNQLGGYLQDKITLFDKFIVNAGVRSTYFEPTESFYVEPRVSLVYLINDEIKFKGAWGKYNQFANRIIREDIAQGSRDFWILADGNAVPVSFSEHFIAGISYEKPSFLIDVEAYRKNLSGLSEYTTRFVRSGFGPSSTLDYEENFFQGDGVAQGVELLLQKKSGSFTGWLGYTLGDVDYQFDVFGEESFPAAHDVTHEVKLVGSYKWNSWTFAATFVYATGKPYTSPTGAYEITLLDGSTTDLLSLSEKNEFRFPDYHRLDLSATYDFDDFLGSKASIGFSLYNLYNRNNVWYREYDVIEGQVIETDVTLLNATPSIFFNWSLR
ncbi:MAG: TonB-dependent receptor, partial [Bacteroidota bacterium]